MGSSNRLKSALLPIAENRQAKVCDSSELGDDGGVAAGSLQKCSSRKGARRSKVLRPLVKLKTAFVELMVSEGDTSSEARSSAAYFSMGVVMGPVDFGGYDSACYYSARHNNYQ
jgi:hypothetical protein